MKIEKQCCKKLLHSEPLIINSHGLGLIKGKLNFCKKTSCLMSKIVSCE